jgi:hypothetical protein
MLACPVGSRSTHPSRSFITTHPGRRTIQDSGRNKQKDRMGRGILEESQEYARQNYQNVAPPKNKRNQLEYQLEVE